ncbi:MAG: 16S rRNA (adenine(1518)-N(6)/adenine(1519)-N(6))-dimethyltransferase RsmA [Alloprevotella sp.]|nr:16S rRNA (adenine(1518)-N(6)/adenine(1519)-N(6))-dimethyltransferase RsmA [Alloprevotella sp.]
MTVDKIHRFTKVRPKKNLGQHFLTDLNVARRIADTVDVSPELPVLEVGPGMGVLTQYLLEKGRELKVVEIDRESVTYLNQQWPELSDRILSADFLRMDLLEVFEGRPFVLIGNYPYDISSQIFFKMLDNRALIPCCTGMIQHEMAYRIAAHPGTKAYGILSVLLQMWYDIEYCFTVEPGVFNPPPKVKSAVFIMRRNGRTEAGCNEALLKRLVKFTFQQRRKMLRGTLRSLLAQIDAENKRTVDHSAFLAHSDLTRRPEQLSVEDFISLCNEVESELALKE